MLLSACAAPQATSSISSAALSARMQDLTPDIRTCLSAAREPITTGTIDLTWVVEEDGRANLVRVDHSSIANASVEGCVAGIVRRSTFPPPQGEPFADAHWTLELAALGPATALANAVGVLGPTEVNAVLSLNQNTLASCLAMAQAGGREVTGELELHWRVGADGQVAWARVASATVHDVEVERCLVSAMMTMSFPPPQGGATDLSIPLKLL